MTNHKKSCSFNRFNTLWMLNLFGTAVGAGVLFLPINAGKSGFWPLLLIAVLVGPMTYYAHQGLSRFVLSSPKKEADVTLVAEQYFGKKAGIIIAFLYFFAIFPILLIYGNGITNTVDSFIVHQLGMVSPKRYLLSGILVGLLVGVMFLKEQLMLKITEYLVYPLIIILLSLSLYLIPHWNLSTLQAVPTVSDFVGTLYLTLPVIVFSFNHSPAISQFTLSMLRHYGDPDHAERQATFTEKGASTLLLVFVMIFVFSCVLSLTPAELHEAKEQNISVLSYLANKFDNLYISYLGPFVAFLAIASSFFGHYLGAREGVEGLYLQMSGQEDVADRKKLHLYVAVIFFGVIWGVAIVNPSILGVIESFGGPFIAMILFIMPMYAISKVPAMQKYAGKWSNSFTVVMGTLTVSAVVYKLFF